MSKTNILNKTTDNVSKFAAQTGLLLMTAAAVSGMIELPNHENSKIVLPNQPSFSFAEGGDEGVNPLRREKEESAPHFISYSVYQRTPGRSGKH